MNNTLICRKNCPRSMSKRLNIFYNIPHYPNTSTDIIHVSLRILIIHPELTKPISPRKHVFHLHCIFIRVESSILTVAGQYVSRTTIKYFLFDHHDEVWILCPIHGDCARSSPSLSTCMVLH